MARVDSKGRIVLPKEVRESLGIDPGTEVEIHEENGKPVVEPEDDPEQVIDRLDQLVVEIPENRDPTPYDELGPQIERSRRDDSAAGRTAGIRCERWVRGRICSTPG